MQLSVNEDLYTLYSYLIIHTPHPHLYMKTHIGVWYTFTVYNVFQKSNIKKTAQENDKKTSPNFSFFNSKNWKCPRKITSIDWLRSRGYIRLWGYGWYAMDVMCPV